MQKPAKDITFYTDDPEKAHSKLAIENREYFVCEMVRWNGKRKIYSCVWGCTVPGCEGFTKTFGVLCKQCSAEYRRKRPFERAYNKALKNAPRTKKSGVDIKWLISYDEFKILCELSDCHYCLQPLNRAEFSSDGGTTAMLLDRKDSNGHYTFENCVPCCPRCNDMKGQYLSYDQMMHLMAMDRPAVSA